MLHARLSLLLAAMLAAVGACDRAATPEASSPPTRPAAAVAEPTWAAFHGGGTLVGVAPDIAPPPMKLRWTYRTSDQERAAVEAAPVILDGVAYVPDMRGTLHAIDLAIGKARWTYTAENGFDTTPLVINGRVFLGDLGGVFHAISAADGQRLWTIETDSVIHSSANAEGGRIVFGTDAAEVYCVDADGKVLWKGAAGDRINGAGAIWDGAAYFSGCDAQLRAFSLADGRERFAADLGMLSGGACAIADRRVVAGTDQGRVICLSIDGRKQLWLYEDVEEQAMVYSSPAIAEGIVVVGARDRQVHAIDLQTGKRAWAFRTRGDVDASPLISGGRVYVGSRDKSLYVLDLRSGKELWTFTAGRAIVGGCAIGGGVVVFGDTGGSVYCLEPAGR